MSSRRNWIGSIWNPKYRYLAQSFWFKRLPSRSELSKLCFPSFKKSHVLQFYLKKLQPTQTGPNPKPDQQTE
ncbi:MAG: hypothetical protein CL912_07465 [Deltaproteobacteria bacterium]|nr:hypothetical protein [Deltaproteobacteria bacterium]